MSGFNIKDLFDKNFRKVIIGVGIILFSGSFINLSVAVSRLLFNLSTYLQHSKLDNIYIIYNLFISFFGIFYIFFGLFFGKIKFSKVKISNYLLLFSLISLFFCTFWGREYIDNVFDFKLSKPVFTRFFDIIQTSFTFFCIIISFTLPQYLIYRRLKTLESNNIH
jgi:hypothetical protein